MNETKFLELLPQKGYKEEDFPKFKEAINFTRTYLKDKIREAGDTYLEHNLRVAATLVESKVSPEVVIAGILHGTSPYCSVEEIGKLFGEEAMLLVQEEERLKRLKPQGKHIAPEALRKILLTMLKDVRVVLIKLSNKLDNLRTIHVLPESEQKRISEEVLEVYAPLAYRLGMEKIKIQLEDLAFKITNPKKYSQIENFLKESSEEREQDIKNAISAIGNAIKNQVSVVKIKGRPKQIYSIYRKMTQRKVKLNEQYDLLGVRIIVPEIKDCYTLLGLLHENFDPIEGKLKDYVTYPKPNFYRSIHTAVILPNLKMIEIQIRTPEMDEFAEEGIAAHWRYKGSKSNEFFEKKISWLKGVLDLQKDGGELIETAKIDVFGDRIHCYTPQGDMKELPFGATILDFAYLVHEEVGGTAVGGRINGKFVPLRNQLKKGDVVEIVTNKNQRPRRSWLKVVKSARAKQKIRKSLREHEKGLASFYYRLIKPTVKEEVGLLVESESFPNAICGLAKCCRALPGEEIIGLLTKRRVISVHKDDCRSALKEQDRWIPVSWKNSFSQKINFSVHAGERSGILADLLHTIVNTGFQVEEAKAKLLNNDYAECSFLVVPKDLEELKKLIERVGKVNGVKNIYFD
jgi:GTP diphosphokinase / guanosine-3',5'-bis(diphosphate) 3'-diphosphatase